MFSLRLGGIDTAAGGRSGPKRCGPSCRSVGGPGTLHGARAVFGSFQNFILKGNAIVLLESCFRGSLISEHLDVLGVTDLLAGGRRPGR